jgi:hypothetical protein
MTRKGFRKGPSKGAAASNGQPTAKPAAKPRTRKAAGGKPKFKPPPKVKAGDAARAGLKIYHESVKELGHEVASDAAWTAQVAVHQRDNDRKDLIVAGEARKLVVGIPLPSLALMHLFQSNVLPVGRIYQITGEEGSSKSSFLAEMMRWVLIYSGYAMVFEVEGKDIAELREAIWEYNSTWLNVRSLIDPCDSLNHWMRNLGKEIGEVTRYNEGYGGSPGIGWRNPYIFGVDAFTSAGADETIVKIGKEGAPGRSHPIEANLIAQYSRTWTDKLRGTSIIVAGTNHLKPKRDDQGNEISHSPGGKALKFMESVEIQMRRLGKYKEAAKSGVWLWIETMKSSIGERLKSVRVAMVWDWRYHDDVADWRQHAYFDWHTATLDTLLQYEADKDSKKTWNAINDIVDINAVAQGRYWSYRLGIPKEKPVRRHEFGRALDYDRGVCRELFPILGITRRPVFRPGERLVDTIVMASAKTDAELPDYYAEYDANLNDFADVTENLHRGRTARPKDAPVAEEDDDA